MAQTDNNIRRQFSTVFPKLSFRWRYEDGEYSVYAPFTEAIFEIGTPDDQGYYTEGYNTSMCNSVSSITIRDIPRGGPDVVAIDVVYKETTSEAIHVLQTIELPPEVRGSGVEEVVIEDRSFGSILPPEQLLRPFDNVPRRAKAQEITASRLMYGNYLQNYNQPSTTRVEIGTELIPLPLNGTSVKTSRSYQIGTVYEDEFGRWGALIADPSTSFSTDFTYSNRIRLTARVSSQPPEWAVRFKHFVRDLSLEHRNLVTHFVYDDVADENSDNVWIQFNSNDVNKVQEGDFLIPRRHTQDDPNGTVFQELSRHPILSIENEAPESVRQALFSTLYEQNPIGGTANSDRFTYVAGFNQANNDTVSQGTGPGLTEVFIDAVDTELGDQAWFTALQSFLATSGLSQLDLTTSTSTAIDTSGLEGGLYISFRNHTSGAEVGQSHRVLSVQSGVNSRGVADGSADVIRFELETALTAQQILVTQLGELDFTLDTRILSEEGGDRIDGAFFVKTPRTSDSTSNNFIPTFMSSFDDTGEILQLRQMWFETERNESGQADLNLFYEASNSYPISSHGQVNPIKWSNCIATVDNVGSPSDANARGMYLESVRIFDYFNSTSLDKGVRVNTPQPRYEEERRLNGIIFSGIFNSTTGINRLNQFIQANGIEAEIDPNYGSIQKLHTRDNYLISLCENKVFRTLADKDLLFNADGDTNVTSTRAVLGDTSPYGGEYGISKNPESFATYGHNIYFTDANRGEVMQLTPANGQLFPISNRGMADFFRDRFASASDGFKAIGSFNDYKNSYILSLQGYNANAGIIGTAVDSFVDTGSQTVAYDLDTERFPSRYSFIPEAGISLKNRYYTFFEGKIWVHNSTGVPRNNFYGVQYETTWDIIVTAQNPSVVKEFITLGYEGDDDWELVDLSTPTGGSTGVIQFVEKEGKYHAAISGTTPVYEVVGREGSVTQQDGDVVSRGFVLRPTGATKMTSGIRGLYAYVRLRNTETTEREIHAINTTFFNSSF